MHYKTEICWVFLNIGHKSCPKNAFRHIYITIKSGDKIENYVG